MTKLTTERKNTFRNDFIILIHLKTIMIILHTFKHQNLRSLLLIFHTLECRSL